ncbi:hypothetical protein EVAR_12825_1 [Eumeta japonica]|uniref:Uncharacterized protein n=1 Tax=Eumeta variegata TaxID=151549 RepID=A0A4C1UAS6_EUMVA|nr:hypothetical protein EVAR_12825_1 [Eumeta japonica]
MIKNIDLGLEGTRFDPDHSESEFWLPTPPVSSSSARSSFIRHPIPFLETGNSPVIPLALRVLIGDGAHLLSDDSTAV